MMVNVETEQYGPHNVTKIILNKKELLLVDNEVRVLLELIYKKRPKLWKNAMEIIEAKEEIGTL